MGIYKNDYNKNEDELLWELHEIRQKLSKENKKKSIKEINNAALKKYEEWKKVRESKLSLIK